MPIWLFVIIVFTGAFLGSFFAATLSFSKREDEKNG